MNLVVRVSSSSELDAQAWANVRAILPAEWELEDDGLYESASRRARSAERAGNGCALKVGGVVFGPDGHVEDLLESALHAIDLRKGFLAKLMPDLTIECFIRLVDDGYVGIEMDPSLLQRMGSLGVSLFLMRG